MPGRHELTGQDWDDVEFVVPIRSNAWSVESDESDSSHDDANPEDCVLRGDGLLVQVCTAIRREREALGMTHKELSTSLGIDALTLVAYERGTIWPKAMMIRRMHSVFGNKSIPCATRLI